MLEYNQNLKAKNKGVMNWFISIDNVLHVLIDIYNITYCYKVDVEQAKEDPVLLSMLDSRMSILNIKDEFEEKVEPFVPFSMIESQEGVRINDDN